MISPGQKTSSGSTSRFRQYPEYVEKSIHFGPKSGSARARLCRRNSLKISARTPLVAQCQGRGRNGDRGGVAKRIALGRLQGWPASISPECRLQRNVETPSTLNASPMARNSETKIRFYKIRWTVNIAIPPNIRCERHIHWWPNMRAFPLEERELLEELCGAVAALPGAPQRSVSLRIVPLMDYSVCASATSTLEWWSN